MRVYLAGPMRNMEKFNFPLFLSEATRLRELGFEVVNPAEMDLEKYGEAVYTMDVTPDFFRDCMKRDLVEVLSVDGVVLLPGWEKSTGALIESFVAMTTGGFVISADTLRPISRWSLYQAIFSKFITVRVREYGAA